MKNVSIYGKKWLDLVFEGKNKEYGAYELRQQETKTTAVAFIFSVTGIVAVFGLTFILTSFDGTPVVERKRPTIVQFKTDTYKNKTEEKKVEKKKEEEVKKTSDEKPKENKPLEVAKKQDVVDEVKKNSELPKTNANPNDEGSKTGTLPFDDKKKSEVGGGSGETKLLEGPVEPKELDRQPMFPGGMQRFVEYVGNHFEKSEMEEEQTIRVYVSFVIEVDGSMTSIHVFKKGIEKLDNEAIRVLKSLRTKWSAGYKDNQPVRTQFTLPIVILAE